MKNNYRAGSQIESIYKHMMQLVSNGNPVFIPAIIGRNGIPAKREKIKCTVRKVSKNHFPELSFVLRKKDESGFILSLSENNQVPISPSETIPDYQQGSVEQYLWLHAKWVLENLGEEVDVFDIRLFGTDEEVLDGADRFFRCRDPMESGGFIFYAYVTRYGWLRIGAIKKSR